MLIRPHDDWTGDEAAWRSYVESEGFGQFCVNGLEGVPVVVPTQFLFEGDEVVFHLAKANPVFDALAANPRAVLNIGADWVYVPGSWKAIGEEDPSRGIPTTYYSSVQLSGSVTITDDVEEIAAILRRQLADVEIAGGGLVDPSEHASQFRVIRGIRLTVEHVRAKAKYGGNVDAAHRHAVAARLQQRDGPGDATAAGRIPQ